jgi:hypothetical protein
MDIWALLELTRDGVLPSVVAVLLLVSLAGARLLPLAMAIGLYVSYGLLLKAWPPTPVALWHDQNGAAWTMWSMVAMAALALLERNRLLPLRIAPSLSVLLAGLVIWLVLGKVAARWSAGEVALLVGGGGVIVALTMLVVRLTLQRRAASVLPAVLMVVVLSIDAGLVTLGKSALLGQLCGAVAAALGAAVATNLWRRGFALQAADGVWLGGAHALFVLAGVHLAYLEWAPAGCALAAPFLLLLVPRSLGDAKPWRWFVVAAPLVLAPLLVAMWLARPESNPYGY